ncbi:hypothetical protein NPIL_591531 [Nephila pilipes]|uniref:Uncharacterized protein n=1 Tax=Nephila pilipes TaxID=299642 RepID=A0A8X6QXJ1_NEPPI|nr:hypothetical protein NPIL_591531 [Nephila pilipes]
MNIALRNLYPSRSPGPDNIYGKRIQYLPQRGKRSLLEIFNVSWKYGKTPLLLETCPYYIIPIRKSEKLAGTSDSFRLIALTSVSCELMERKIFH